MSTIPLGGAYPGADIPFEPTHLLVHVRVPFLLSLFLTLLLSGRVCVAV